jgi:hypothetical protein
VKILSDCEVERLTRSGEPKRIEVRAKLADGRTHRARARRPVGRAPSARATCCCRAAGGVPVGKGFSCNMGAPLTAEFDSRSTRTPACRSPTTACRREPGYAFETWFNPPVSQALNMPGWFEQHFENMRRYDHLMASA